MSISTASSSKLSISASSTSGSNLAAGDPKIRNLVLFRKFEKAFGSIDDPNIESFSKRFAVWLINERAYYDEALPEILKLLQTLQGTLRKAVGVSASRKVPFPPELYQDHPMSGPYQDLVRAVYPFAHKFERDPGLKKLLSGLFESVNLPWPERSEPPKTQVAGPVVSSQNPVKERVVPPTHPVQKTESPSTSPALVSAAPQTTATSSMNFGASTAQPHARIQGQNVAEGVAANPIQSTLQVAVSQSTNKRNYGQVEGSAAPNASTPGGIASNPTTTKRKKKRKSLNLDTLAELDLKNYKARQEQVQNAVSPRSVVDPIVVEDHIPTRPARAEHSPEHSKAEVNSQPTPKRPRVAAAAVPADATPQEPIVIHSSPEPQPQPEPAVSPLVKVEPQEDAVFKTVWVGDREVIDLASDEEDAMQVDQSETPADTVVEPTTSDSVSAQNLNAAPRPHDVSKAVADGRGPSEPRASAPPALAPVVVSDEVLKEDLISPSSNMSIDSDLNEVHIQVNGRVFTTLSAATESHPWEAPGHAQARPQASPKTVEAPVDDADMPGPDELSVNGQRSEVTPVPSVPKQSSDTLVIGTEVKVVAFQRGLHSKGDIQLTFQLGESDLARVEKWTNQTDSTILDLQRSLCISLACYPAAQLDLERPLEPQLSSSLVSSWPVEGGLSLKVFYKSKTESISLSPPFLALTPDSTVDVSMFAKLGSNELQVDCQLEREWSQHVFVLLAHQPTEQQISKVQHQRDQENAWQNWLKEMARPFDLSSSFKIPKLASEVTA